jgi:DUF1016 N-terminal domain
MTKEIKNNSQEFEQILTLITEARNRVYSKANSELVLLYFNVGKVVSEKVIARKWGENTVQELANFIQLKVPHLSGFNRRGLYRMKQFFEVYSGNEFLASLANILQSKENQIDTNVSTLLSHLQMADDLRSNSMVIPFTHSEQNQNCRRKDFLFAPCHFSTAFGKRIRAATKHSNF